MHIYQKSLKDEFERRILKNKEYSLRAFSRDLKVPSSKLSQYLSGTCGISNVKAEELARNLGLSQYETDIFVASAEAAHARSHVSKDLATQKLNTLLTGKFQKIDHSKLSLFDEWYTVIIMSMIELDQFVSDTAWIAKVLNLSEQQVVESLEKLTALGFVDRSGEKWMRTSEPLRKFQSDPQFLETMKRHRKLTQEYITDRHENFNSEKMLSANIVLVGDDETYAEYRQLVIKFGNDAREISKKVKQKKTLHILKIDLCPVV
jgi:uncharacterized protein (TIGR02147 family)